MFGEVPAKEWGTVNYHGVPRQQCDGIFYVHDVSMPDYLPPP